MKGMGKAIRRYREEAGITQERLAELVDISTNHLGAIEREVEDILKKIGLQDKKDAMPSALSGGQKQRTAIARALVTRPAIILADEPTGNLDSQTELEVMSLLKSCVSDFGQTLIMITHDETIAQMADEMIIIEDGKAVRR